ncbi:MAG: transposase [Nodosilinea sp.]
MSKAYTSNLTRDQFELIEPMLPKAKSGGRPRTVCLKLHQLGETMARIYLVWVDGGYSGPNFLRWAVDTLGWIVHVVLRPQQSKEFILLKKRWIVERTFGWWQWSRRLAQD